MNYEIKDAIEMIEAANERGWKWTLTIESPETPCVTKFRSAANYASAKDTSSVLNTGGTGGR